MEEFIPTRGSEIKKNAAKQLMVVNYEAPKKKAKRNDGNHVKKDASSFNDEDKDMDPKRKQELEMKRIRYEVMRFGMSGFEKVQAKEAKVQLAISLGAKPPKNRSINYKTLKEQRGRQKEKQKIEEHASGLEKSMKKHKTVKTTKMKKKGSGGILDVYGKVSKIPEGRKKR
ncbi:40S small subunit processome assembly factor 1 [Lasioglossum baleicum]|uniref:40S small subunit processome assembly factor 1 n=1 Tax=Lasioglossum baleicum TaxID=434251 RepID=UPI003FCD25B7